MTVVDRHCALLRNPKSSRAPDVEQNVVVPLLQAGISFDQWTTNSPNAEDNINDLAGLMRAGDRIAVASGDGVAHQLANAALRSGLSDIEIAVLGYGGFNDMAETFTDGAGDPARLFDANAKVIDVHPLEVYINDVLHRYGVLYSSKGYTAQVIAILGDPELRASIQNSTFKKPAALFAIIKDYCRQKKLPLPDFIREGSEDEDHTGVTDTLAINGPITAHLVRSGKRYFEGDTFLQTNLNMANPIDLGNINFLGRSAINLITGSRLKLPGREVTEDNLTFNNASFAIQHDGEMQFVENVNSVRTTKSKTPLHFVTTK